MTGTRTVTFVMRLILVIYTVLDKVFSQSNRMIELEHSKFFISLSTDLYKVRTELSSYELVRQSPSAYVLIHVIYLYIYYI